MDIVYTNGVMPKSLKNGAKALKTKKIKITDFAVAHGLTLKVSKFVPEVIAQGRGPYFGQFDRVEVMEGGELKSSYEEGKSIDEILKRLCKFLSNKRIAVNAYKSNRQEIEVPELYHVPDDTP